MDVRGTRRETLQIKVSKQATVGVVPKAPGRQRARDGAGGEETPGKEGTFTSPRREDRRPGCRWAQAG